jgi:osmotically-inducible protein OsmY
MLCVFGLSGALLTPSAIYAAQNHAPDNTAVNKQERATQQPMADQAKNNRSDRDLAKHLRRDVVHGRSLSAYGHNVKIIADRGKAALRGLVHSEDEKRVIEEYARGMDIPEYETKRYEGRIKEAGILLSVHSDNSDWTKRAKDLLKQTGAEDVFSTSEASADYAKRRQANRKRKQ